MKKKTKILIWVNQVCYFDTVSIVKIQNNIENTSYLLTLHWREKGIQKPSHSNSEII